MPNEDFLGRFGQVQARKYGFPYRMACFPKQEICSRLFLEKILDAFHLDFVIQQYFVKYWKVPVTFYGQRRSEIRGTSDRIREETEI